MVTKPDPEAYQPRGKISRSFTGMPVFQLQYDPFPDTAGEGCYFSTPALDRCLDELRAAVRQGHVLLVDEAGSGKSTLLDHIESEKTRHIRCASLSMGSARGARDFLHGIVQALGLPPREPPVAELRDVDTFLERLGGREETMVLVVDDAQLLDAEALEQLLYLSKRWERQAARFLLSAEPDLLRRLQTLSGGEQFLERATAFSMPRFDREQVDDYVHTHLHRAGQVGDSPFTATVIANITVSSQGRPGEINRLARKIIAETERGNREGRGGSWRRVVARGWPIAAIGVVGLGVALLAPIAEPVDPRPDAAPATPPENFRSTIMPAPNARKATVERRHHSPPSSVVRK